MKKRNRNYSTSFKQKVVELSYAYGHVKQVCEELDIPYSVLHRWRRESQDYGKNSFPGRGGPKLTHEQKEIALLKKQLKDISEEHEILKKAVSISSKSDRKNLGS
jgi:transposase